MRNQGKGWWLKKQFFNKRTKNKSIKLMLLRVNEKDEKGKIDLRLIRDILLSPIKIIL